MGYSAQSSGVYQDWTPAYTGFSVNPSGVTSRYTVSGKMCSVYFFASGGTSNATGFTITLPFNAKTTMNMERVIGIDNGTGQDSWLRSTAGSNVLTCYRTISTLTWTASGTKYISFNFTYEIE